MQKKWFKQLQSFMYIYKQKITTLPKYNLILCLCVSSYKLIDRLMHKTPIIFQKNCENKVAFRMTGIYRFSCIFLK